MKTDLIPIGINCGCWDAAMTSGLRVPRADAARYFGRIINGSPVDWDSVGGLDVITTDNGFRVLSVYPIDGIDRAGLDDPSTPYFPCDSRGVDIT